MRATKGQVEELELKVSKLEEEKLKLQERGIELEKHITEQNQQFKDTLQLMSREVRKLKEDILVLVRTIPRGDRL